MQAADGLSDEFVRRVSNIQNQRVRRFFEVSELPGENGFPGKMTVAAFNVVAHFFVSAAEVDDAEVESCGKPVAIALLERGTRQHDILFCLAEAQQLGMNICEPGKTVGIGQRNAVFHFFDVSWRVKIVGVEEGPSETIGEQLADGGLTCSGCAHHENDHGGAVVVAPASGAAQREQRDFRRDAEANRSADRAETAIHINGGVWAVQRGGVQKFLRGDGFGRSE